MKILITLMIFSSLFINTSFADIYRFKCTSTSGTGNYVDIEYNNYPKQLINLEIYINKFLSTPNDGNALGVSGGLPNYVIENFYIGNSTNAVRFEFIMDSMVSAKVYIDSREAELKCERIGGGNYSDNGPVF